MPQTEKRQHWIWLQRLRLLIISICRCLFFILDSRQPRTINLPKHSSENNNSGSSPFALTSQGGQHKRSRCGCLRACLLTYMASLKRRSVKFKTERDGERTEVAFSQPGRALHLLTCPLWRHKVTISRTSRRSLCEKRSEQRRQRLGFSHFCSARWQAGAQAAPLCARREVRVPAAASC